VKHSITILVLLLGSVRFAHADASADVTQAFADFITAIAKNKAPAVDLFISPGRGDQTGEDDRFHTAVPADLSDTRAIIASPKLKTAKVVVSKSGKSAWIAGEVPGSVKRNGKQTAEPIRVSAFLVKSDAGWKVQATHWSTGEPDQPTEMCGSREDWMPVASIPKDAQTIVDSVFDGLSSEYVMNKGPTFDTSKFLKILSDDPNAYVIGSAPKEIFAGGAKIKSVFKKWEISAVTDSGGKHPARAAIGPDGEMMWIAMGVIAPAGLCVSYRTLLVLAKEKAGWRIVHQHYSQPASSF